MGRGNDQQKHDFRGGTQQQRNVVVDNWIAQDANEARKSTSRATSANTTQYLLTKYGAKRKLKNKKHIRFKE